MWGAQKNRNDFTFGTFIGRFPSDKPGSERANVSESV